MWLLQSNADMVLSSKLVLYDLENQTIGWTEYNCEYGVHAVTFMFLVGSEITLSSFLCCYIGNLSVFIIIYVQVIKRGVKV